MVPTDIASGLILVQYEQATQPQAIQLDPLTSAGISVALTASPGQSSDPGDGGPSDSGDSAFPNPKTWMTVHNAAHFMRFALGSYTWPIFMYMNPMTGCCKLTRDCM